MSIIYLIITTEAINFAGQSEKHQQGRYEDLIPTKDAALFLKLSELAKRGNTYLVAGAYYKEQGNLYNAAFVYGRDGKQVECYHKVHLAGSENNYLTEGNCFPIIDADFGKFGVAVCWDMQFPEMALTIFAKWSAH